MHSRRSSSIRGCTWMCRCGTSWSAASPMECHRLNPWFGNARATARVMRATASMSAVALRSEEHTSELQSQSNLVCRLLLEKKKKNGETIETQLREMTLDTVEELTLI